eukprot:8348971-Alexandrium_andersonii.AAC.1
MGDSSIEEAVVGLTPRQEEKLAYLKEQLRAKKAAAGAAASSRGLSSGRPSDSARSSGLASGRARAASQDSRAAAE